MTDSFILELIERFNASTMAALDITQGTDSVSLKKAEACNMAQSYPVDRNSVAQRVVNAMAHVASGNDIQKINTTSNGSSETEEKISTEKNASKASSKKDDVVKEVSGTEVKSPLIGTFYRAPSPDAPSYVEVGSTVKKGQPLCILEAMKMLNTLEAEFDGVVEQILAENGDLVEFDQPIFIIKKSS